MNGDFSVWNVNGDFSVWSVNGDFSVWSVDDVSSGLSVDRDLSQSVGVAGVFSVYVECGLCFQRLCGV